MGPINERFARGPAPPPAPPPKGRGAKEESLSPMAKLSSVLKNERRKAMVKQYAPKFAALKAKANDTTLDDGERLIARLKMAELPRNANPTRVRNRCQLTGRSRGNYRKFGLSRIMLRELGNKGLIPGLTKSSW